MKLLTKILTLVSVIAILFSVLGVVTVSAAPTTLHFEKNTIEVGDTVKITVKINPNEFMSAMRFTLKYDAILFDFSDATCEVDAQEGVIKVENAPAAKFDSIDFTFTAVGAGKAKFAVEDCKYFGKSDDHVLSEDDAISLSGAAAIMTIKDAPASGNARLKSLKVNGYKLNSAFSSHKTVYDINLPYEVEMVDVIAVPAAEGSKIKDIIGNTNLKVGTNTIVITVEAVDGTQKQYKIIAKRLKEGETDFVADELASGSSLKYEISGADYYISSNIPQGALLNGFTTETVKINGFEVQTAVDNGGNFRLYYLHKAGSSELEPYIYNDEKGAFEKLKYTYFAENLYIFSPLPEDIALPSHLNKTNITINDFKVECLASNQEGMADFFYIYCFNDGDFDYYKYDNLENTVQRAPDFAKTLVAQAETKENIFTKFSALSTNGKVIIIAFIVVILGLFSLLILLMVYLIRRSFVRRKDFYDDDFEDFDQIDIKKF